PEQVETFQCPDPDTLLGYQRAVIQRMNRCLESLSLADLDREVDADSWSKFCPTVASRLIIAVDELLQHAGQVCYIRGLRQGTGWQ
ncbi:DinB family protein, partial [Chloroflexota bacterium]